MSRYDMLKAKVMALRQEGKLNVGLTREERADWAYGTTVIENSAVTRDMTDAAVQRKDSKTVA